MRHAITLIEVLISLGILTIGLLGVAAVFPVGSHYLQKADIADNGSALAQAVMNDIITRGTVNPKAWYAMVPQAHGQSKAHDTFSSDSQFVARQNPNTPGPVRPATFTRPFATALAESLQKNSPDVVARQFGSAYVIDPLYVAASTLRASENQHNVIAYGFPASAARAFPNNNSGWNYYKAKEWDAWRSTTSASNPERLWPIRRVTLQDFGKQGQQSGFFFSGWSLDANSASYSFRSADELVTDLPSRADRPARQNWEIGNNNGTPTALSRQRTGNYSWIVSVVPTTSAARDGLATSPASYSYDVSVVVFHKRLLPTEPSGHPSVLSQLPAASLERTVQASVLSTGLNGGELLLQAITDGITPNQPERSFENLKTGEWLMLCGPHPNTTAAEPRFVLNWYQIMAIDKIGLPAGQRIVVVRGREWPWQPADNTTDYDKLSNSLCVGICRGAVAVHAKTIRLEGAGDGMALVKP